MFFPTSDVITDCTFEYMVRHRVRTARIFAAILALALSAQVAGAESANCIVMSNMHTAGFHTGAMQHQHHADNGRGVASRNSGSQQGSSSISGCGQNMLCVTAAGIPSRVARSIGVDTTGQTFSFGASELRARTLSPDPPPPRI